MSKVIRISEETFIRLQDHAEPLVDTPATVIERLLDFYDRHNRRFDVDAMMLKSYGSAPLMAESLAGPSLAGRSAQAPNLFLTTTDEESSQSTILGSVPFSKAERLLSPRERIKLRRALDHRTTFHCWAMTEDNRSTFDTMRPGDFVLISVSGSGVFNYLARLLTKLESEELGETLWPHEEAPLSLIYVIEDVQPVSVDKKKLVKALGYSPKYRIPGITHVDPVRLEPQVLRFGSVEGLLWGL